MELEGVRTWGARLRVGREILAGGCAAGAGLTCVGCAVTVGLCDLALLKVLMRPDGVVDVRGTQDVVSPTSRTLPAPIPVAGRRGGGGRGGGEAEGLHARKIPGVAHLRLVKGGQEVRPDG